MTISDSPEWIPLATAVEHVARVRNGDALGVLGVLRVLLCDGLITGRRRGRNTIAPDQWKKATVGGDGTAELVDGFDGTGQLVQRQYEIELRRADLLRHWPETGAATLADVVQPSEPPTTVVYRTGSAGRPTSRDLIEGELRRRWADGERHPRAGIENSSAWARELSDWLRTNHPEAPQLTPKTIINNISQPLRKLAKQPERPKTTA
jgi:hypothetical protein